MIFGNRTTFKPFTYPTAYRFYEQSEMMRWTIHDIILEKDMRDWKITLSESEKHFLTQIFRFFTQSDVDVAGGYYDYYIPFFKYPEIRMMLGSFANRESEHIRSYDAMIETVGMPEVEHLKFLEIPTMLGKHEYIESFKPDSEPYSLARNIAVYSLFTEGLQLFSSFAMLLSFQRFGIMRGMTEIVEYSIKDEELHIKGMTWLLKQVIKDHPEIWTAALKADIINICHKMVMLEDLFINTAFEMGGVRDLEKEDVKKFIRTIADKRLESIGLEPQFNETNPLEWLSWVVGAVSQDNFFETHSTEYTEGGLLGTFSNLKF